MIAGKVTDTAGRALPAASVRIGDTPRITLTDAKGEFRFQRPAEPRASATGELMTVKLRYKQPDGDTSRLISVAVRDSAGSITDNVGFASAVAAFSMLLRKSEHRGAATYADTAVLARRHRGRDETGYRAEFARLVELAEALSRQTHRD